MSHALALTGTFTIFVPSTDKRWQSSLGRLKGLPALQFPGFYQTMLRRVFYCHRLNGQALLQESLQRIMDSDYS